jgi:hypothetical protein
MTRARVPSPPPPPTASLARSPPPPKPPPLDSPWAMDLILRAPHLPLPSPVLQDRAPVNDGHRRTPPATEHCCPFELHAPRRCHTIWVGPHLYHLARRLCPSLLVLHPVTSSPPVQRRAAAGHATTRAVRAVATCQACTAAPAGTGCAGCFRTWAVTRRRASGPNQPITIH